MRKGFFLFLLFLISFTYTYSQSFLYVAASSGLKLREQPSPDSEVTTVIPYGTLVEIIEWTGKSYISEGLSGHWVKAKHKSKTGYLFSGYLLPLKPPVETTLEQYIKNNYSPKSDAVTFPKNPDKLNTGDSYEQYTQVIYDNGIYHLSVLGYEYHSITFAIPLLNTIQETFLFIRLIPEFKRFVSPQASYPPQTSETSDKHVSVEYFYGKVLKSFRIDIEHEFLEVQFSGGRIEIISGGGV